MSSFNYNSEVNDFIEVEGSSFRLIDMMIACGYGGAMGLLTNGQILEFEVTNPNLKADFMKAISYRKFKSPVTLAH